MRRGHLKGFTLVEVLVAIGLLLALSGVLSGLLFGLMERRDRVAIEAARQGAVDVLFAEIDGALVGAFVEGPDGAGIVGSERGVRIMSRGVRVSPGSGLGDVVGIEFVHDPSRRVLMARRFQPGDATGAVMEVAATDVARVRVRYLDGAAWKSSFDSGTLGRLPAAVEVSVWFDDAAASGAEEATRGGAEGEDGDLELEAEGLLEDSEGDGPAPSRRRVMVVPDGPEVGNLPAAGISGGGVR